MEAKLDSFGRVLIPRKLRARLVWRAGARLRVDAQDGVVTLSAARQAPAFADEGGLLVFTGEADGDLLGVVSALREERLSQVGGEP